VVVQLSTSEGEKSHELLYRYVLVVDVSSTMGSAKHEHKGSLLERVKVRIGFTLVDWQNYDVTGLMVSLKISS